MLPSGPRMNQGLPTTPRSRSLGRTQNNRNYTLTAPSEPQAVPSLRSQKSLASFPTSPRRSATTIASRSPATREYRTRQGDDYPPVPTRHQYDNSDVSSLSSAGSIGSYSSSNTGGWRGRTNGYASSRTSIEDDSEQYLKRGRQLEPQSLLQRLSPDAASDRRDGDAVAIDTKDDSVVAPGEGYNLWNRVASAAGNLTISVSKAWTQKVTTYAGEVTPPGQDSHLTRVMKAYYIEKARDPSDLPEWLFEEHERRPLGRSRAPDREPAYNRAPEVDNISAMDLPQAPRNRGLRDVYDAAVARNASTRVPDRPSTNTSLTTDQPVPSKAADRLRALRDAKRSVNTAGSRPLEVAVPVPSPPVDDFSDNSGKIGARRPVERVGLPSGPGRVRARNNT